MNQHELHPIQMAFLAVGAFQGGYSAGRHDPRRPRPCSTATRTRPRTRSATCSSGILDRESAYLKPVEAVKRAAAVLRGEPTEPFRPEIVAAMTDGRNCRRGRSDDVGPTASPAVPRLILSKDVPEMTVVGKPELKVDGVKLVRGNPAFTDDIELRGHAARQGAAVAARSRPHPRHRRLCRRWRCPGVHAVIHHRNVPRVLHATGGQSWPNPLPVRPGVASTRRFATSVTEWPLWLPRRPKLPRPPSS